MRYIQGFAAMIFLLVIVAIGTLRDKVLGLSKKYNKKEIWYVWYPVKTRSGEWVWRSWVERSVSCNADLISLPYYVYRKIDV